MSPDERSEKANNIPVHNVCACACACVCVCVCVCVRARGGELYMYLILWAANWHTPHCTLWKTPDAVLPPFTADQNCQAISDSVLKRRLRCCWIWNRTNMVLLQYINLGTKPLPCRTLTKWLLKWQCCSNSEGLASVLHQCAATFSSHTTWYRQHDSSEGSSHNRWCLQSGYTALMLG